MSDKRTWERVILVSQYYPPNGDDLRRVSFDLSYGSFECLKKWRFTPSSYCHHLIIEGYYVYTYHKYIRNVSITGYLPPTPDGYERLRLYMHPLEPLQGHVDFHIDEGTLDQLIEFANFSTPPEFLLKCYKVSYLMRAVPLWPHYYEGNFRLIDLTDEST